MSTPSDARADLVAALDAALRSASGLGVVLSELAAERAGLSPTDIEALEILERLGPMPAGRLAAETGLTTGAITGLVDRLERGGYARRESDPSDRRRVIVRALPLPAAVAGHFDAIYGAMARATYDLYGHYDDEQLAFLIDFLDRARDATLAVIAAARDGARGQERDQDRRRPVGDW